MQKVYLVKSFINTFCCTVLCIFYMRSRQNLGNVTTQKTYQNKIELRLWGKETHNLNSRPISFLPSPLNSSPSTFLLSLHPHCVWGKSIRATAVSYWPSLNSSQLWLTQYFLGLVLHPKRIFSSRQNCFPCVIKLKNYTCAKHRVGWTISVKALTQVHVLSWEC